MPSNSIPLYIATLEEMKRETSARFEASIEALRKIQSDIKSVNAIWVHSLKFLDEVVLHQFDSDRGVTIESRTAYVISADENYFYLVWQKPHEENLIHNRFFLGAHSDFIASRNGFYCDVNPEYKRLYAYWIGEPKDLSDLAPQPIAPEGFLQKLRDGGAIATGWELHVNNAEVKQ